MRAHRHAIAFAAAGMLLVGCGRSPVGTHVARKPSVALGYFAVSGGKTLIIHGAGASPSPSDRGPVVVNMWAQWCGPCRQEAAVLRGASPLLRRNGVELVGVDTEDVRSLAQSFTRSHKMTWPEYFDPAGQTLHELALDGLPDTVILRDGKVAGFFRGPIPSARSLLNAVRSVGIIE